MLIAFIDAFFYL